MNWALNRKQELIALFSGFIIFLVTFPKFVPDYGTGLDPSYVWALNYLFVYDYDALVNLIYPIGPFGFLKYTVAFEQNLFVGIFAFSAFKFLFIYLLLRLTILLKGHLKPLTFFMVLVVASFTGIDFSIIGSTVVLLLFAVKSDKKYVFFLLANLIAFVGLCIKSSIGIAAYSSVFTYLIYVLFSKGIKVNKLLGLTALSLIIFVAGGAMVFRGFGTFFKFLTGLMHLAGGYSSALALFPENNWWLLGGFVLTILAFLFLVKRKDTQIAFLLLVLPLFAMWKHAMGREDVSHAFVLATFLFIFWGIIFLNGQKVKAWYFVFPFLSIFFVNANMQVVKLYKGYNLNIHGVSNFTETVIHFSEFDSTYKAISEENISQNRLDESFKKLIGNKSIDVYPWELSYVPENNLNFQPRKTLELGAANSQWLSKKNALCFEEDSGPEFVLLHLNKDKWGGSLGTLDGRHLLNDEPLVVFNFLKNYKVVRKTNRLLLLQKRRSELTTRKIKDEITSWNTWIAVPQDNKITRVKFISEPGFLLKIKSFLYKDEAFFIDYRLENNKILSYRFIASNAANGLWVNPLVLNPESNRSEPKVKEIRFRSTNSNLMEDELFLGWESLDLTTEKYFGKNDSTEKKYVFRVIENYDSIKDAKLKPDGTKSFSGNYSEKVLPKTFSSTTKILLDTLWKDGYARLNLEANLMYFVTEVDNTDAVLVISVQGSDADFWKPFNLSQQQNEGEWNFAVISKQLNKNKHQKGTLSIYVWNKGSTSVYIDNFSKALWYD